MLSPWVALRAMVLASSDNERDRFVGVFFFRMEISWGDSVGGLGVSSVAADEVGVFAWPGT